MAKGLMASNIAAYHPEAFQSKDRLSSEARAFNSIKKYPAGQGSLQDQHETRDRSGSEHALSPGASDSYGGSESGVSEYSASTEPSPDYRPSDTRSSSAGQSEVSGRSESVETALGNWYTGSQEYELTRKYDLEYDPSGRVINADSETSDNETKPQSFAETRARRGLLNKYHNHPPITEEEEIYASHSKVQPTYFDHLSEWTYDSGSRIVISDDEDEEHGEGGAESQTWPNSDLGSDAESDLGSEISYTESGRKIIYDDTDVFEVVTNHANGENAPPEDVPLPSIEDVVKTSLVSGDNTFQRSFARQVDEHLLKYPEHINNYVRERPSWILNFLKNNHDIATRFAEDCPDWLIIFLKSHPQHHVKTSDSKCGTCEQSSANSQAFPFFYDSSAAAAASGIFDANGSSDRRLVHTEDQTSGTQSASSASQASNLRHSKSSQPNKSSKAGTKTCSLEPYKKQDLFPTTTLSLSPPNPTIPDPVHRKKSKDYRRRQAVGGDGSYPAREKSLVDSHKKSTGEGKPWRLYEGDAAINHMLDIRDEAMIEGEERFRETSRRLLRVDGIDRSWGAVKNYWNRAGRMRSGFDERKNKKAPLATSQQGKTVKRGVALKVSAESSGSSKEKMAHKAKSGTKHRNGISRKEDQVKEEEELDDEYEEDFEPEESSGVSDDDLSSIPARRDRTESPNEETGAVPDAALVWAAATGLRARKPQATTKTPQSKETKSNKRNATATATKEFLTAHKQMMLSNSAMSAQSLNRKVSAPGRKRKAKAVEDEGYQTPKKQHQGTDSLQIVTNQVASTPRSGTMYCFDYGATNPSLFNLREVPPNELPSSLGRIEFDYLRDPDRNVGSILDQHYDLPNDVLNSWLADERMPNNIELGLNEYGGFGHNDGDTANLGVNGRTIHPNADGPFEWAL